MDSLTLKITTYRAIVAPYHVKYILYGLNATDKMYLLGDRRV